MSTEPRTFVSVSTEPDADGLERVVTRTFIELPQPEGQGVFSLSEEVAYHVADHPDGVFFRDRNEAAALVGFRLVGLEEGLASGLFLRNDEAVADTKGRTWFTMGAVDFAPSRLVRPLDRPHRWGDVDDLIARLELSIDQDGMAWVKDGKVGVSAEHLVTNDLASLVDGGFLEPLSRAVDVLTPMGVSVYFNGTNGVWPVGASPLTVSRDGMSLAGALTPNGIEWGTHTDAFAARILGLGGKGSAMAARRILNGLGAR